MGANRRHLIRAFPAGAVFGAMLGLLAPPALAQTYFERVPGTVCKATTPGGTTEEYGVGTTGAWVYNNGASAAHFVCPVPDKSDLQQGNISEIRVDVDDWNDGTDVTVDARVCAFDSEDASSGACGNWEKSDSDQVDQTLVLETGLELSPLGDAGETAYLWIVLPAKDGSATSSINGLYFEDD